LQRRRGSCRGLGVAASKDGVKGDASRRGTAGHSASFRRIGPSSSPSLGGIARSEAPASPSTEVSSVSPEPCRAVRWAGGCQSFRQAPGFGHAITKRPAPRWNRPSPGRITTMAARLPSRALPRSIEAAKLSIITVSTGLLEGNKPLRPIDDGGPGRRTGQPSRPGRVRLTDSVLLTKRSA
jgi:hypothetical protein